jgi:hypothetical protein
MGLLCPSASVGNDALDMGVVALLDRGTRGQRGAHHLGLRDILSRDNLRVISCFPRPIAMF